MISQSRVYPTCHHRHRFLAVLVHRSDNGTIIRAGCVEMPAKLLKSTDIDPVPRCERLQFCGGRHRLAGVEQAAQGRGQQTVVHHTDICRLYFRLHSGTIHGLGMVSRVDRLHVMIDTYRSKHVQLGHELWVSPVDLDGSTFAVAGQWGFGFVPRDCTGVRKCSTSSPRGLFFG